MLKSVIPVALLFALTASTESKASVDLTEDEFRLYCGYLVELEKPEIAKLKGKARDTKIAQRAKVKPAALMAAVEKGTKAGATCDEIAKKVEADARTAINAALGKRVVVFNFDYSTPEHVVAQVTWLGLDKKKVLEEASLLATVLANDAKITKTIAIRAVDPQAPDTLADTAMWWEGKITRPNATRIDKSKIPDYALTRYARLFDGCKTTIGDEYCPPK
jgi:hypothetical protein